MDGDATQRLGGDNIMVAKRHHYVPKCYLESFAIKSDKNKKSELCVFDAVGRKSFSTAPDNVALQTDFNTIDLEGHPPDAFELAMASVESDIGPALTRIIAAQSLANQEDKTLLLNLIGLLHIRNPRLRERFRNFRERVAKMILDVALSSRQMWESQVKKAQDAGFMPKDVDTEYVRLKKKFRPADYKTEVANEEHIRTEMQTFDHILPLLFERKWALVKAPEGSQGFITSDHPVCLMWSEPDPKRGRLRVGLKHKGTEILFPISPKLAVVGAYEIEDGVYEFDEEDVASFNGTIALHAQRQVYAPTMYFAYQIDQSKPPKKALDLLKDEQFKETPKERGHAPNLFCRLGLTHLCD
jgi:hypothetical protein